MKKDKDYQLEVSLSKATYKNKNETKAAIKGGSDGRKLRNELNIDEKISFVRMTITPQELLEKCLEGHTFCHLFGGFPDNDEKHTYLKRDGNFTLSGKSSDYFVGSYIIGIDVDKTCYGSPTDYISRLSLQPTFWYTSLSNMQTDVETGEFKGPRFRLIYVFDKLISDKYFFRYCSWNLHRSIEADTGEPIKDSCGLMCTQYFNGTNWNDSTLSVDFDLTNCIYSLSDIGITDNGYFDFLHKECYYKNINLDKKAEIEERICLLFSHSSISEKTQQHSQHTHTMPEWEKSKQPESKIIVGINDRLFNDAERLPYDEFYRLYKHQYEYVFRVERDEWENIDGIKYQQCNENYLELTWIRERLTDGHHRRRVLFYRAFLRRIIKPEISADELFFNLVVDRELFFDNSDGVLSADLLRRKVQFCFEHNSNDLLEKYEEVYKKVKESSAKKKIIIHRNSRGKIQANSLVKELRWKLLDVVYDQSRSVEENLQILNDSDFKISSSALYRYISDRGIKPKKESDSKYEVFKRMHLDGISIRKEQDYLKNMGLSLSTKTIASYRKRINSET